MLFDFGRPLYTKQDCKKYDIDKTKFYYIAFFNNGLLDTRPIKIDNIFSVNSTQAGSKYIRTDVTWSYHFETEKIIYKKVLDKRFWKKLLRRYNLVEVPITDKWKIDYDEDWDMLDFYLIGKTPDEAKLRLIMAGLKTPHPDNNGRLEIVKKELEIFKETHPDLVMKAMDYRIDTQYGNITNYSKFFLNIKDDIRNM